MKPGEINQLTKNAYWKKYHDSFKDEMTKLFTFQKINKQVEMKKVFETKLEIQV